MLQEGKGYVGGGVTNTCWEGSGDNRAEMLLLFCLSQTNLGLHSLALFDLFYFP